MIAVVACNKFDYLKICSEFDEKNSSKWKLCEHFTDIQFKHINEIVIEIKSNSMPKAKGDECTM